MVKTSKEKDVICFNFYSVHIFFLLFSCYFSQYLISFGDEMKLNCLRVDFSCRGMTQTVALLYSRTPQRRTYFLKKQTGLDSYKSGTYGIFRAGPCHKCTENRDE